MPYRTIKQAEKTFRTAIYSSAVQFDQETVQRAESLLLQARALAGSEPLKSKSLAEHAQQIALEAIAKTLVEKTRLKVTFSSEVASLFQEYSRVKTELNTIKEKISKPSYLIILQRMEIANVCMKHVKEGLDKEQFHSFHELYTRTKQRLSDVSNALTPVLKQLNSPDIPKARSRKQRTL